MGIIEFLLPLVMASPSAQAVECRNTQEIAKEAVAYSLVGAWAPFTTHACFKNERFKYFRPELGEPEGEVIDASKLIWFDKARDKYKIESVSRNVDGFDLIKVTFTIGGREIRTTYEYHPDPDYAKRTGICGHVINDEHGIFRKDCVAPGRLPALTSDKARPSDK